MTSDALAVPSGTQPTPVVSVTTPAELVAAVPYLLGFEPTRSLVLICFSGPRERCGLRLRVDLPRPEDLDALVDQVVAYALRDDPDQVALLVFDEQPWSREQPPWVELVERIEARLDRHDVGVREAAFVTPERFWSYGCLEPSCCPATGTPRLDGRSSVVAASFVAQGCAPLADRQALRRSVEPRDPDAAARVGTLTSRCAEGLDVDPQAAAAEVERLFGELVARARGRGSAEIDEDEAATLLAGLAEVWIRDDVALRWSTWLQHPRRDRPGSAFGKAVLAEQEGVTSVLAELVTMCDGPWAVAPLTLLALEHWQQGAGAPANVAIERALELDPDYRMALLVDGVLAAGIRPS